MSNLTTGEAAEALGVSRNTLLRWFREGRISEVSRDFRGWRTFRIEEIDRIRQELGESQKRDFSEPKTLRMRRYLRSVPFFRKLPDQALDELGLCARFQGLRSGHFLFSPGEKTLGLHILVKGKIRLYKSGLDGREQTLSVITPFQTLGEAEIFRTRNHHNSFALCQTSSTVVTLPQFRIRELALQHPELALAFLGEFAGRIQRLEERLGDMTLLTVEQRLVRLLLDWAGNKTKLVMPMRIEELASVLGSARETLSRTLAALERRNLIKREGTEIELLNPESLQSL